ncbi:MAG: hypothetical protein HW375_1148 [Anaerolineales bacterium]|nr:hypothetical protein [Anaerolineales bacterium]
MVANTPAAEPLVVTHLGAEFQIYALDGTLLETRSAEGLSWARPNTAQVVGQAIYFVAEGAGEDGAVVRRVTSTGTSDLEFTRSDDPSLTVTFAVSDDESRIAWGHTSWAGGPPFSQLWMADIAGGSPVLIAQTETLDDVAEFFVLEPVRWLDDGDLVYAWQVTGIGGYILFFGWSSLYSYDVASGAISPVASLAPNVTAPCWTGLTGDGAFAAGACGAAGEVIERNTQTCVDTVFPLLADQGQAGAWAMPSQGAIRITRPVRSSSLRRGAKAPRSSPLMRRAPLTRSSGSTRSGWRSVTGMARRPSWTSSPSMVRAARSARAGSSA